MVGTVINIYHFKTFPLLNKGHLLLMATSFLSTCTFFSFSIIFYSFPSFCYFILSSFSHQLFLSSFPSFHSCFILFFPSSFILSSFHFFHSILLLCFLLALHLSFPFSFIPFLPSTPFFFHQPFYLPSINASLHFLNLQSYSS